MSNETANIAYNQVFDTARAANLLDGLVNAGVLPENFRILKGTVDITGAAGNYAVVDADGNQLLLRGGDQVIYMSVAELTAAAGGTSANVGLAATASGAVATALSGVIDLAAMTGAGFGLDAAPDSTDASAGQAGAGVVVPDANPWVTVTTLGTFTAGELQVFLIVA